MKELIANKIRRDVLDIVHNSAAGHIGGDLSCADILAVLYGHIMNVSPETVDDPDRDRFILSKAHCAEILFATLANAGYFSLSELKTTFSKFGSRFIGHPNREVPGVEICGGSLGHGLSVGVGIALAGKRDKRDYRTYVLLGDGEMAEGSNYEAMMAAAHYKLDNLCATVDLNGLQISGKTEDVMNTADLGEKFAAFGWEVIDVRLGNNTPALVAAYEKAKKVTGRPSVIIAHTVKGKGVSFMENEVKWHHGVMSDMQYEEACKQMEKTNE